MSFWSVKSQLIIEEGLEINRRRITSCLYWIIPCKKVIRGKYCYSLSLKAYSLGLLWTSRFHSFIFTTWQMPVKPMVIAPAENYKEFWKIERPEDNSLNIWQISLLVIQSFYLQCELLLNQIMINRLKIHMDKR